MTYEQAEAQAWKLAMRGQWVIVTHDDAWHVQEAGSEPQGDIELMILPLDN